MTHQKPAGNKVALLLLGLGGIFLRRKRRAKYL
ncbi:MAG: PEP-CTERM sorting domain-containing protein [Planctomycetota bacterium]